MKDKGDRQTCIAGNKTTADWRLFKQQLLINDDENLWRKAFQEYFEERLNLRYLNPVKILQDNGTFSGEGFSIMAILCTLVEFLESTVQGLEYKCVRYKKDLNRYEYSNSQEVFVNFLFTRTPFNSHFNTTDLAREFYKSIRCGLLHEARTKNGWRILAKSQSCLLLDKDKKIVYRDDFEEAIKVFISDYGDKLGNDKELQQAFIRKFDSLCT